MKHLPDFPDFLRRTGHQTAVCGDCCWYRHGPAMIPAVTVPQALQVSHSDARSILSIRGPWLARWHVPVAAGETSWWAVVCRNRELAHLSRKSRYNVRRQIRIAHEQFDCRQIDADTVAKEMYRVHAAAYERYEDASPMSESNFRSWVSGFSGQECATFWGSYKDNLPVAWAMCWVDENGVFVHTLDADPEALKDYAAYGLMDTFLAYYLDEKELPVSNGVRSVVHATEMQDFLRKLGFLREYGQLFVAYHPLLGLTVSVLRHFRCLIPSDGPFSKVRALLEQDRIARLCQQSVPGMVQRFLKRSLDVLLSGFGLIVFGWVIVFAWIASTLDTKANGIFVQRRVGRFGKVFKVFKIRTMRKTDEEQSTVTVGGDVRITRLGRLMRRFKIDELPQLVNVLFGKMSFVGPRPDVEGWADKLEGEDRRMLNLRPGITGPATMRFRDEEELLATQDDPEEYNRDVLWPEKVRLNLHYHDAYAFGEDLLYIIGTVVPGVGRRLLGRLTKS